MANVLRIHRINGGEYVSVHDVNEAINTARADAAAKERERIVGILLSQAGYAIERRDHDTADVLTAIAAFIERGEHNTETAP